MSPLRASSTTTLPFPVQIRVFGTGWTAEPPAAVRRPKFPLAFRMPLQAPRGGQACRPTFFPSHTLHPYRRRWSATHPFRGRGGLHGLTERPEGRLARVSGLPRFDRITAAVSPMRDVFTNVQVRGTRRRRQTKTRQMREDVLTKTLFLGAAGGKSGSLLSPACVSGRLWGAAELGSCGPPASARRRGSHPPRQRPSKRELCTNCRKSGARFLAIDCAVLIER